MAVISHVGQELTVLGYESVTVAASSIGFTSATITPATGRPASRAVVTVETAQIRYRLDGSAPTSTEGHILEAGDTLVIEGIGAVSNARFIRTGANSATIRCTFERLR